MTCVWGQNGSRWSVSTALGGEALGWRVDGWFGGKGKEKSGMEYFYLAEPGEVLELQMQRLSVWKLISNDSNPF